MQSAGGLRSISDAIEIPFRVFANTDTAVGRLLQYGAESVTAFLKGGFDQFESGLPTIEGLADFADRFKRVPEVAERLDQLDAATVTRWLSEHPSAVGNILEFNPADAANAALIDRLNQTIPGRFSPENLVAISMRNNPSEPTIKVLPRGADPFNPDSLVEIEGPIFLEIGSNTRTIDIDGNPEDNGAGLVHILAAHATDFNNQGIPEDRIVDAVIAAVTKGTDVG
ncbi:hypothetical protein [Leptolyngbya sp. NK1-12]|uniref:hypothetical protein n=1 Tax=Leptolyngbya sp. NK1-12 TaxID=2547451 RepID=UPI00292FECCF|nr:hypothetical protein [Leptolyngbya sp. NK1-12]